MRDSKKCSGWCGLCYENAKGRANHPGHYQFRPTRRRGCLVAMQHMQRPDRGASGGGADTSLLDAGKIFKTLPALWEFLTVDEWSENEPRVVGTLLLFTEDGRCKICANDRDGGLVCFTSGESFDDALRALDRGLKAGDLDWRLSRAAKDSRVKRKK